MSTQAAPPPVVRKHQPYVPATMEMKEFTFRAVVLGMLMTGILGAANAYLGLRAGQTMIEARKYGTASSKRDAAESAMPRYACASGR